MKYNKSLERKIVSQNKKIGEVLFLDGLCDVTDPCYDKDTWCALHNVKIMPGVYSAFIDEVNYPNEYIADSLEDEAMYNVKKGDKFISDDIRIMALTIVHEEYVPYFLDAETNEYKLSSNIGVDAGLCGFYNHKPDFKEDDAWYKFVDSLDKSDNDNVCDCHHGNGVTVSSGFGDGVYKVYKLTYDRKVIGLQLLFN